jgi:hypothetical protein
VAFRRENPYMAHLQWEFFFNYVGISIQSNESARGGSTKRGRQDLRVREPCTGEKSMEFELGLSISSSTIAMEVLPTPYFGPRRGAV